MFLVEFLQAALPIIFFAVLAKRVIMFFSDRSVEKLDERIKRAGYEGRMAIAYGITPDEYRARTTPPKLTRAQKRAAEKAKFKMRWNAAIAGRFDEL